MLPDDIAAEIDKNQNWIKPMSRRSIIKRAKIRRTLKIERALYRATVNQIKMDTLLYGSGFYFIENKRIHRVPPWDVQIETRAGGQHVMTHKVSARRDIGGLVIL